MRRDVLGVCFDKTGKKLVSCSADSTIRIWDATTGEPIGSPVTVAPSAHLGVQSVSFSPEDNVIAAGCSSGKIYLLDALVGEVKSTLRVDSGQWGVMSVSCLPKDNVIAAGCFNGKIHLVDAVAGEVKSTLTGHRYVPSL